MTFTFSGPAPKRRPLSIALQFLFSTAALGAAAQGAQAQSTTTLAPVTVTGERDEGYAASVSRTATKTDTPLRDTPQSISVVTQDEMRDRAVQSVAEAALYVPGVGFAQGEGNRETPIFRGISTTGDFYVDGIRDDVQYYRDLYNIDSVDVLRGPNAMVFGRGATGGLINRNTKQAVWEPIYAGSLTLGSYENRRATVDLNQPLTDELAFRLNGMYEDSNSYRDGVEIKRSGVNPTLSWKPSARTRVTVGYEHFEDDRTADRGIPSFRGRPVDTARSTFFGDPDNSPTWTRLNAFNASVEHQFNDRVKVSNRTRYTDQDKFYQNVFPGAVSADGSRVNLAAYNNATQRKSLFNQTDLTLDAMTGSVKHRLLVGTEFGRQETDNYRQTGYFSGTSTGISVPVADPMGSYPVAFRQSATDADNSGTAKTAAIYLQDQIELTRQWSIIAGVRYDSFKVDFQNNRNGQKFDTSDDMVSPRLGLIYKPVESVSLYGNYSVAYQPRAGDQLASLSLSNEALRPEKFKNYEIGAKWDIRPDLATTIALYQLERNNVIVLDPSDPTNTRTMLSDGQRTRGVELSISGRITPAWSIIGAYTYADAEFVSDTSATQRAGGAVSQVAKHTFALWNRYDFTPQWGAGVGVIHRSKIYAANEQIATASNPYPNVELPSFTRVDAALFYTVTPKTRLQLNVENLFDKHYYLNSNSNSNITPGSPRAVRLVMNTRF